MQAVGPLLAFSSSAHEAAFQREFISRRVHLDPSSLLTALALNALVRCKTPGQLSVLCGAACTRQHAPAVPQVATVHVQCTNLPVAHHVHRLGHSPVLQACLLPLHSRDGVAIAAALAQSAYMAALLAFVRWLPEVYGRHRSMLLFGALLWQAAVSVGGWC